MSRPTVVIALCLALIVLAKTVLQLCLYLVGYMAYAADDFGRVLKADYWLRHPRFDLGTEGWLGLGGSGWLPFPDYLFGIGLALHRDLYFTPKMVNLAISGIGVIAAYGLGRALFGRSAGLMTAILFAFQPWGLWLGISGMTSDLPSVVTVTVYALFLFRWLDRDDTRAMLAAAGSLFIATGLRYENWLFSVVFAGLLAMRSLAAWRRRRPTAPAALAVLGALAIATVFPLVWMATSYSVLGTWLPGQDLASGPRPRIGLHRMVLTAFPLEALAVALGVIVWLRADRRRSVAAYLAVILGTFLLFLAVYRGDLPLAGFRHARVLLPYVALLLPFAAYLITRLARAAGGRPARVAIWAGLAIVVTIGFDIARAFEYPDNFPTDAIHTGWTVRNLQSLGSLSADGRILIEAARNWGHLGVVALANKPERFALLDRGDMGRACAASFASEACQRRIRDGGFTLVILSSEERAQSFEQTFGAPSWRLGRYLIFEIEPQSRRRPSATAPGRP